MPHSVSTAPSSTQSMLNNRRRSTISAYGRPSEKNGRLERRRRREAEEVGEDVVGYRGRRAAARGAVLHHDRDGDARVLLGRERHEPTVREVLLLTLFFLRDAGVTDHLGGAGFAADGDAGKVRGAACPLQDDAAHAGAERGHGLRLEAQ